MVKSVYSEKTEIRLSNINGKGLYAKEKILKGEIVAIKGGHILTKKDVENQNIVKDGFWPLDDNYYLGTLDKKEQEDVLVYMNHSCEPNCGIRGDIVFVTMRDIEIGEELTFDYAMIDNEDYTIECNCKKKSCRKILNGKDWKIKNIQDKYCDYFATYLKEKINKKQY